MTEEAQRIAKPIGWVENVRQFFRDVMFEMKKVTWATRTEVVNTTMVVVVVLLFFAFYLFGIDMVLAYLVRGVEWVAKRIFG
jgi:preprotein translocase subunit SecE